MKLTIVGLIVGLLFSMGGVYAESDSDSRFKWREVRQACKGNHDSEECLKWRERAREYCVENPDKRRCKKIAAIKHCKQNPESEKCLEHKARFKAYCEKNPVAKKCVRARIHNIYKDDPESDECLTAKENAHEKFCEKHPDHERCA